MKRRIAFEAEGYRAVFFWFPEVASTPHLSYNSTPSPINSKAQHLDWPRFALPLVLGALNGENTNIKRGERQKS